MISANQFKLVAERRRSDFARYDDAVRPAALDPLEHAAQSGAVLRSTRLILVDLLARDGHAPVLRPPRDRLALNVR